MHRHEAGSEEREGEGEEAVGDCQGGADVAATNQQQRATKGKKTTQHQRQRSDAKKMRKEEEGDPKKNNVLSTGKDSAAVGEGDGGRMRRCKQQVNPTGGAVRRPAGHVTTTQQHLPQPLARRRQRRLPRPFTPPKEDVERGLRSLTRYIWFPYLLRLLLVSSQSPLS